MSGGDWRRNLFPKIAPFGIVFFDQIDLPISIPLLDLAFARERRFPAVVRLVPDQFFHVVFAREARQRISAVLPDALHEIVSHANVEGAIALAGHYVDEEAHAAAPLIPAKAGIQQKEKWRIAANLGFMAKTVSPLPRG